MSTCFEISLVTCFIHKYSRKGAAFNREIGQFSTIKQMALASRRVCYIFLQLVILRSVTMESNNISLSFGKYSQKVSPCGLMSITAVTIEHNTSDVLTAAEPKMSGIAKRGRGETRVWE